MYVHRPAQNVSLLLAQCHNHALTMTNRAGTEQVCQIFCNPRVPNNEHSTGHQKCWNLGVPIRRTVSGRVHRMDTAAMLTNPSVHRAGRLGETVEKVSALTQSVKDSASNRSTEDSTVTL